MEVKERRELGRKVEGTVKKLVEVVVECESDSNTNSRWCPLNYPQRPGKEKMRNGDQRKNRDHPCYRIAKIW